MTRLELLACGEMEVVGRLPYASNATFLVRVTADEDALAVYKPRRGERPLWDFPAGTLCVREYAAWLVDTALGWGLVPPTVLRDGPLGYGAVQLFVEEDVEADVMEVARTHAEALRRLAVFDLITNNADRKAGHIIVDVTGRLWGVDHGICFHDEPKLRTVVWTFEGEEIPSDVLDDVRRLPSRPPFGELSLHLSGAEMDALRQRISAVVDVGRFPAPGAGRRAVPWPPW